MAVPGASGEEVTCAGQVHVEVASRDLGAAVLGLVAAGAVGLLDLALRRYQGATR